MLKLTQSSNCKMKLPNDYPKFKYHRSPISSGSIVDSDVTCVCCNTARGFIYTGPVYATKDLRDSICPWCIGDGSAHEKLDCEFVDFAAIGGFGQWDDVSDSVREEVAYRTPGFSAIQEVQWWTHCGDAAQFLRIEDDNVIFQCLTCEIEGGYIDFD